jgi:hypothetical protein
MGLTDDAEGARVTSADTAWSEWTRDASRFPGEAPGTGEASLKGI